MTTKRKTAPGEASKVAVISLHTSPQDPPGQGDAGGMNVYVSSVARQLAEQGIAVDVFTRSRDDRSTAVRALPSGGRLIEVPAGPMGPLPKEQLPRILPEFLGGVLQWAAADPLDVATHRHSPYDVVHSHYWLSGWVGSRAKEIWGVPHVASFHTLGKVKNSALAAGDRPEPPVRLRGEAGIVRAADRILAPTPVEAASLMRLYGAEPGRIRIVPPGVDRRLFAPRPREEAKARLHLAGARVLLFVGRLQPLKGPDVAIRALADAARRSPASTADVMLAVVGGPPGANRLTDTVARLMQLAASEGVSDRVVFFPPQPHERLADFYSAAEVLLVPSRSESFGLVALEAQACGTPVVAAAVGGLRYAVADGISGFVVEGDRPAEYADRILSILNDPALAARLGAAAARQAARFSWEATAADIRDVYRELVTEGGR